MPYSPRTRSDTEMKNFKAEWGFKPRRKDKGRLGCIHPSPSTTAPAVVAAWTSVGFFIASGAWFAVSIVGYGLVWKYTHPLPKGETTNIERIFATPPLNRWAVNVVMSWFVCTFMLIQTFFLIGYRMDRRVKRDFARQVRMNLAIDRKAADKDSWDDEELDLAEEKRLEENNEVTQYNRVVGERYGKERSEKRHKTSRNPGRDYETSEDHHLGNYRSSSPLGDRNLGHDKYRIKTKRPRVP